MKKIRCELIDKRPKAIRVSALSTLGNIIHVWIPISQIVDRELIPRQGNAPHRRNTAENFNMILAVQDWVVREKELAVHDA